jgi:hypothetical protein
MRLFRSCAFVPLISLIGCSANKPDYVTPAQKCVQKVVPKGTKVSAERARSTLAACRQEVLGWANGSMRNACRGECDYTDPKFVREFGDRKEAIEEMLLLEMSDEIEPRFVRM